MAPPTPYILPISPLQYVFIATPHIACHGVVQMLYKIILYLLILLLQIIFGILSKKNLGIECIYVENDPLFSYLSITISKDSKLAFALAGIL